MYSRLAEVAIRDSQVSTRPGYVVVTHRTTDCYHISFSGMVVNSKIIIFEYTKVLEICTMRFRMNFDMGIFPKHF
jgi:hypothetical protein